MKDTSEEELGDAMSNTPDIVANYSTLSTKNDDSMAHEEFSVSVNGNERVNLSELLLVKQLDLLNKTINAHEKKLNEADFYSSCDNHEIIRIKNLIEELKLRFNGCASTLDKLLLDAFNKECQFAFCE